MGHFSSKVVVAKRLKKDCGVVMRNNFGLKTGVVLVVHTPAIK